MNPPSYYQDLNGCTGCGTTIDSAEKKCDRCKPSQANPDAWSDELEPDHVRCAGCGEINDFESILEIDGLYWCEMCDYENQIV